MKYQTRIYLHGLFAAAIGGFANVISNITIDHEHFNLTTWIGFKFTLLCACISAGVAAALYLREHPLPDPDKDIDAASAGQKQITNIKENLE